ncbi:MAG: extracellular solute-binding protein, partial [Ktedonobacterales bacterium]|nr:extracellular solute-binding protein [Ktedonobacterales bacterium]
MHTRRLAILSSTLAIVATLFVAACGSSSNNAAATKGCTGKVTGKSTLTAWFHSGTGAERDVITAQVAAFNASQSNVTVKLVLLPEGNYDDQVKAAAASNSLPDILDFDGPLLYNYAWNKDLVPLDNCVTPDLKGDLLQSIVNQGTYANHFYGIGTFDSGLALYARKSLLQKANVRIPTGISDAWSADEFTKALLALQKGGIAKPLDLKLNYGKSEWFSYGFSPVIQSAGGDLINRSDYKTADGALNGAQSVAALTTFQSWFKQGLVNPNTDDKSFINGTAAISWVGHWQFNDYQKAWGSDLALIPLPNFGQGSKTGLGSLQWCITQHAASVDGAWSFINYLMQDQEIQRITTANGAVPSRKSAAAQMPQFSAGGAEYLYIQQLESNAVSRPQTP